MKILKKGEASLMGGESSGDEEKSEHDSEGEEENTSELRNARPWIGLVKMTV